tara:strand:- start:523 stop:1077 length:555 start_codon:yes stop_codon:yes gene_type:complete
MSSELRVDKIIPTSGVPTGGAGGIIQIQQTVKTDFLTISANDTITDVTSVNITPHFSTSKIFVMVSGERSSNNGNNFGMLFLSRVVGGSTTDICIGDSRGSSIRCTMSSMKMGADGSNNSHASITANPYHIEFLDSPNTTSACTYKLRATNAHTGNLSFGGTHSTDDDNRTSTPTVITVMEFSA